MNQLNGKYVNVVLSVESGRGMDFIRNGVHIVGIFNNRVLESDKVAADESPLFNTELVWEVDKRQLRKLRSANQPLRVECVCADSGNRRERVGFALLSLRSAQIVPESGAEQELSFAWHRLIGCQGDKRRKKRPELYLSLALRDHLPNACASAASVLPFISQQVVVEATATSRSGDVAVRYLDDGFIQVGDERADKFLLNVLVRDATNLHALLPEAIVFDSSSGPSCFLAFEILGVTVRTKPIGRFEGRVLLDEKIVVNVLSDEATLRAFFAAHAVPVTFGCGEEALGVAEVETSFEPAERECFFRFPSANGIVPYGADAERSPRIRVAVWVTPARPVASNFSRASLDEVDEEDEEEEEEEEEERRPKAAPESPERRPLELDASPPADPPPAADDDVDDDDPSAPYRKYVVDFEVAGLLWTRAPPTDKITFRFLHPSATTRVSILAEAPVAVGEWLAPGPVRCRLGYVATAARLERVASAWRPWLVLGDERERALTRPARLVGAQVELPEAGAGGGALARVRLEVRTRHVPLGEPEDYERLYLLPAVLDDSIAVRELADLEAWKEARRAAFDGRLEATRAEAIERLEREYRDRRAELERKLSVGIDRCHELQEHLRTRLNSLRNDRELERCAFNAYSEIFTANWRRFGAENTRELVELLSKAQRDNHKLKLLLDQKTRRLEAIERCALSKTQTAHLLDELRTLEEKFEDARATKRYFKEQWRRACEEIHGLRVEELDGVRAQIRESREELTRGIDAASGERGDVPREELDY